MHTHSTTTDLGPKTRREAVADITNAAEFLLSAVRELTLGHPVESKHIQDLIKWAGALVDGVKT